LNVSPFSSLSVMGCSDWRIHNVSISFSFDLDLKLIVPQSSQREHL